jgi:hypothetical protein
LGTLALSLYFVLHVVLFLRRGVQDRNLLVALLALASLFATLTLPLVLARESLTIAWSLLALMFLWLGGRLGSPFLRHAGHALYVVVFARLSLQDLPGRFEHALAADTFADYRRDLLDRLWTFGISIGSVLAAFQIERAYVRQLPAEPTPAADPMNARAVRWRAPSSTGSRCSLFSPMPSWKPIAPWPSSRRCASPR